MFVCLSIYSVEKSYGECHLHEMSLVLNSYRDSCRYKCIIWAGLRDFFPKPVFDIFLLRPLSWQSTLQMCHFFALLLTCSA